MQTLQADSEWAPPEVAGAPCSRGFVALLEAFRATGGTAPSDIVGRLLDDRPIGRFLSLATLVDTGQIFGFDWRNSLWIPMFQFDADKLSVRLGPQQIRAELPSGWPGWAVASWFATPCPKLGGQRPVDVIDSNLDEVMQIARSLAAAPALGWPPRTPRVHQTAARA